MPYIVHIASANAGCVRSNATSYISIFSSLWHWHLAASLSLRSLPSRPNKSSAYQVLTSVLNYERSLDTAATRARKGGGGSVRRREPGRRRVSREHHLSQGPAVPLFQAENPRVTNGGATLNHPAAGKREKRERSSFLFI